MNCNAIQALHTHITVSHVPWTVELKDLKSFMGSVKVSFSPHSCCSFCFLCQALLVAKRTVSLWASASCCSSALRPSCVIFTFSTFNWQVSSLSINFRLLAGSYLRRCKRSSLASTFLKNSFRIYCSSDRSLTSALASTTLMRSLSCLLRNFAHFVSLLHVCFLFFGAFSAVWHSFYPLQ